MNKNVLAIGMVTFAVLMSGVYLVTRNKFQFPSGTSQKIDITTDSVEQIATDEPDIDIE